MGARVAILLDGGFVKKRLYRNNQRFPNVGEIVAHCQALMAHQRLAGLELFRIYYYDAPPYEGVETNPISGAKTDFSSTPEAQRHKALLDALELEPDFAVRRGTLVCHGWKVKATTLRKLRKANATPQPLGASDLSPGLEQKGVDMRIGLDIAWMSLKRTADALVLVTGDSDFVPAMKFARKEGLKVYLDPMGQIVRRELRAHADVVL
jgi:uncharacterized LabA/DUF88 family protein